MWPGGRICSNCALARKRSAQSASTAWIFTGGDGKLEGCSTALELGEFWGGGEGAMSQEHGVSYYFGTARTWHLLCLMSKTKPGLVMRASCLQVCLEAGSSRIFLTTFKHSKRCLFMPALQYLLWWWWNFKAWNWIIHSAPQRNVHRNHPLGFMRKR